MSAVAEPYLTQQSLLWVLVPIILAQVLASSRWVVGVALGTLLLLLGRAGFQGVYTDPIYLSAYGVCVLGLVLTQLVLTTERQTAEGYAQRAEQERARTAAALHQVEQQAVDLRAYTAEQQRLLDLVTTLETPAIMLAPGVLLAPMAGALDQQRMHALTMRLLEAASAQRAVLVILDLAGVPSVDAAMARAVLDTAASLRLLGCQVALTGISSTVAMTLADLDIDLSALTIARSPHEVLAAIQHGICRGRSFVSSFLKRRAIGGE